MILMNKNRQPLTVNRQSLTAKRRSSVIGHRLTYLCLAFTIMLTTSCGVYTFRDVSVDYSKIKTAKVGFIDNKSRYINPQLSPKVTDALKQKINSYTKLTLTNSDDANYQISGFISRYDVSTSAISQNQSVTNRLTVAANITFVNTVDNKTDNFTVSRDFDFPATQTLQQAENSGTFQSDIISQLTDEIFNHIFSNW
jgi:lipopolysaccharide assembly LptE-like protein